MKRTMIQYFVGMLYICISLFLIACEESEDKASVPAVINIELDYLSISPIELSLIVGETKDIVINGYYTDGSVQEIHPPNSAVSRSLSM